jgi:competence protein ComEC
MAAPDWALADVGLPAPAMLASYVALLGTGWLARVMAARRVGLTPRPPRALLIALPALGAVLALQVAGSGEDGAEGGAGVPSPSGPGLEVTVLDVGQGDAILLEPDDGDPVLVDGGAPGSDIAAKLADEGVDGLAAVAVTHDQLDHAGGVEEVLGPLPVDSLVYGRADPELLGDARAAGARTVRLTEGRTIRSGSLRLDVLWPPRSLLVRRNPEPVAGGVPTPAPDGPAGAERSGVDPNALSLVLLARWRDFSMLLTGDAEAESVPMTPGPVDVLKVAHHGSEDSGLQGLLHRTVPRVAVISVGEDNPYGHPAPATLAALDQRAVRVLRTDRDGDVEIAVAESGWTAAPE